MDNFIFDKRYSLENKIGEGGMGAVYQAVDRLLNKKVALKRLLSQVDDIVFNSRGQSNDTNINLAHEFQTLASLRHPNIISVLDYGFDTEQRPYFTMDLLSASQSIIEYSILQPMNVKVRLLIDLLQALAYLHRHGILHRDLKPGNVLVDSGNQVRVLDFGLSVSRETASGTAGTLAYMAPEMLAGESASESSDLYAFGMIAYQLFIGSYPFKTDSLAGLVAQIINNPPDLSSFLEVPSTDHPLHAIPSLTRIQLASILGRLLEKSPTDRYQDSLQVIEDLGKAFNQEIPAETSVIRESFLQAARFVGRDQEKQTLRNALLDAIKGQGNGYIIGGESGVGKSRLLDEVRVVALVNGVPVLRGQASSIAGNPYQLWTDSFRWLALTTDLSDFEAGVLKSLVSDLETLLGRDIPDAQELDPRSAQERLLTVMMAIFRRQRQPLLLVLEDLHWASKESLSMLEALSNIIQDLPFFILGSYRDDEKSDLAQSFPTLKAMDLRRLTEKDIEELSMSMLGTTGLQPNLVKLLKSESEGNAFFVVEVVRALAEEAGGLSHISSVTLPEGIFTGGIYAVIQRRLSHIPEGDYTKLQLAAFAGRNLDIDVLGVIYAQVELENWLRLCADAAVLEVRDNQWRFSHDKLREYLVSQVSETEAKNLHSQLANAIETVYSNNPNYIVALAYHYAQAGNLQKEAHYAYQAGTLFLSDGAYQAAISYLERAAELTVQEPIQEGIIHRKLGDAYLSLGQLDTSRAHFETALEKLDRKVPTNSWQLGMNMMQGITRQVLHRLMTHRYLGKGYKNYTQDQLENIAACYDQLAEIYYHYNQTFYTLNAGFRSLNISEAVGETPQLARGYATMSIVAGTMSLHGVSESYIKSSLQVVEKTGDPLAEVYSAMACGVYRVGAAKWSAIEATIPPALAKAEAIHQWRLFGQCSAVMGLTNLFMGKLPEAKAVYEKLLEVGKRSGDIQQQAWALIGLGKDAITTGNLEQAIAMQQEALSLYTGDSDIVMETHIYGVLARAYLYQENWQAARESADQCRKLIEPQMVPAASETYDGYVASTQVYLKLLEQKRGNEAELTKLAQKSLKSLAGYARVFQIGQPAHHRWAGTYAFLTGNPAKAESHWQKSLETAKKLGLRYEEAISYFEMGRLSHQQAKLDQSAQLFATLGAPYDQKRVTS